MSWEHETYQIKCIKCGNVGFVTYSSDDWNRSEVSWRGFKEIPDPHPRRNRAAYEKCGSEAKERVSELPTRS